MNYNQITQLLENGLNSEEVIAFLLKNAPFLQKKIRSLLAGGWGSSEILSYINQDRSASKVNFKNSKPVSPEEVAALQTYKSSRDAPQSRDKQALGQLQDFTKEGVKAGTTVAGLYGAGKALQTALPLVAESPVVKSMLGSMGDKPPTSIASALPNSSVEQKISEPQNILPISPTQASPDQGLTKNIASESFSPNQNVTVSPNVSLHSDLIKQLDLEGLIQNQRNKLSPSEMATAAEFILKAKPEKMRLLKSKTKAPLQQVITDYLSQNQSNDLSSKTNEIVKPQESKELDQSLKSDNVENAYQPPSEKLVALPNGQIGQVEDTRQGIATVNVNGKKRRVKSKDLDQEPEELEPVVRSLIEAIPEDQRSAVLAYASYNPGTEFEYEGKKFNIPFMATQFHNGDFYLYPGVSKEQFDKVVSKAVKAKTTGENAWHAWTSGEKSRGAGMHQLIKELESQFGKNFIKFKASDGYDIFKIIRDIVKKISREQKS
jgi:hypothetical protein